MNILHCIAGLQESGGGPSVSVPALCGALTDQGHAVTLVTCCYDNGGTSEVPPNVRVIMHEARRSFGLGQSKEMSRWLGENVASFDIVHSHGLWMLPNWYAGKVTEQLQVPHVIAPIGMLEPAALRRRRYAKKLLWLAFQGRSIRRASCLHATSAKEAENLRRILPAVPIVIVPNGVDLSEFNGCKEEGENRPKYVLFLGRVHPHKNVKTLIEAWCSLSSINGWQLVIAGPLCGKYGQQVQSQVRTADAPVELAGPVSGTRKLSLLRQAQVLVLPSKSENFGMVVVEALASGTPVIAAKSTPWSELEERQCGWWIDSGLGPLAEALEEAMRRSSEELIRMGQRGRRLVEERYTWDKVAGQMIEVYEWLLGKRSAPSCVIA